MSLAVVAAALIGFLPGIQAANAQQKPIVHDAEYYLKASMTVGWMEG